VNDNWHQLYEPIVLAVVTGGIGFGFYAAQRIFSAFVALALAHIAEIEADVADLKAWRLRTLESAPKEANSHADSENDASDSRPSPRLRRRNPD
jgi:hypothetical protein